ncbi:jg20249 [Pararge aegeria aegeria]|uniref:Jg20249 protein n=1 Tax=Pararge aegeria aegeria TaxID=348720 RepID=A0A8S4R3Y3_9NEOP|nr:jg20249 [Pararge aegeria aegeria]
MHTKLFGCLVFVILICFCDGMHNKKKVKRKIGSAGDVKNRLHFGNVTEKQGVDSRGFLSHGGIFSLGKVLNFFPVGGERECQPSGFTIARAGICLNPYDCRQRDGKASGDCAHGLGVCCATKNRDRRVYGASLLGYGFVSDILKSDPVMLLVFYVQGQPNRLTGECDEDEMVLGEGATNFTLCGQNHGQHIYYTLSSSETREAGELPHSRATPLVVRMRGRDMPRLWLLRLAQMPLAQSSPHNCLQFHIENNGTIKTFNYASNGRHLAAQEYRACVRRNIGFCSIRYTPCDNRSFRIGPRGDSPLDTLSTDQMDQIMPVDDEQSQDGEEGSGADPQIDETSSTPQPSIISRRARRAFWSWSPYMQHYSEEKVKYYGYGNYVGSGFGRQRCTDRVTIPCENEYFVSSQLFGPGVCDPHHCGNSFCPGVRPQDCRVDTSISPFAVSMHFGAPTFKQNPEENIGMCLRYTQVPCDS